MNKKIITIAGITIGSVLGFLYWYYIGCANGRCPLTSKWYTSSIYGALFGYIAMSLVIDIINKKKGNEQIQGNNK